MKKLRKVKKCPFQQKTMFNTKEQARHAMMRIISHDPHADMFDLHTYTCPHKIDGKEHFHVGHKKWYKPTEIEITDTVSVRV